MMKYPCETCECGPDCIKTCLLWREWYKAKWHELRVMFGKEDA